MQTTHLPTPTTPTTPAADPAGRYGVMTEQVQFFLVRLRRIPIGAWHRCADCYACASLADDALDAAAGPLAAQAPDARRAWERLRAALRTMPGVAARIRRRVDEELSVCDGITSAAAAARMRVAAQLAAAAVAARPMLSRGDFERLYAPFACLIPPAPAAAGR